MKSVPKDKMVNKGVSERVTIVVDELRKAKAYKNKDMLAIDMGISKTALYQAMRVGIMGKKFTDALTDLGYSYQWITTGKGDRMAKGQNKTSTLTDVQQMRVDVNKLRIDIQNMKTINEARVKHLEDEINHLKRTVKELTDKLSVYR